MPYIILSVVITLVIALPLGICIGYIFRKKNAEREIGFAELQAKKILEDGIKVAETKKKEAMIEAKEEILKQKNEFDAEVKERRNELSRQENRVAAKEETLERKTENLERKDENLTKKLHRAEEELAKVEKLREEQEEALQRISGMTADQAKALDIIENAKASRPSVCNAEEVCLVHSAIAAEFLPKLAQRLGPDRTAKGLHPVELRLDERAAAIIPGTPAGPQDFDTEFLDYILAVKVVDSVDEAIAHIAAHSTGHSEAILTRTQAHADRFTAAVDSAAVYVNCSTRFTDGGEFGLGCEMGISTQKLHARGPMGLEELCSYKYIIHGDGQIR